jgi:serine/threonine-protein kinase
VRSTCAILGAPVTAPNVDSLDQTVVFGSRVHPLDEGLSAGTLVGSYRVIRKIAAGGGGAVYEAEHLDNHLRVAVKVPARRLAESPEMVTRFLREAEAASTIGHPNIVDVYETGRLEDGRPFYVMELFEGITLLQLVKRAPLTVAELLAILDPICDALSAAHAAGIVHRDLKTSNIMVSANGPPWNVKLLDFGVAKLMDPPPGEAGLTKAGRLIGTPGWMSPEQFRCAKIGPETDVYALGILVYCMLTGGLPFWSESFQEIERLHLEAPPPRVSAQVNVPRAVDDVVARCLAKQPENRYPSVLSFLAALKDAVQPAPTAPLEEGMAIAIYVEVAVAADAMIDDAALEALDEEMVGVIDHAERALKDAGYAVPVATSSTVVGVAPLTTQDDATRRRALELGASISRALDAGHPSLQVTVCVHVDSAELRPGSSGLEVVSGEVLCIGAWAPNTALGGLCATFGVVMGLDDLSCTPIGDTFLFRVGSGPG